MAIEFHCDHCGKHVRTSDEHAGKRGRCPFCKGSVYIPTPSDQIEPLGLAPVDPSTEHEKQQALEESRDLARNIRGDKTALPPETRKPVPPAAPVGDPRANMETLIIDYCRAMADGDLTEAEQYAEQIRADLDTAEEIIQRLTMDDIVPRALARIPHPVLVGFLRQLSTQH